MDQSEALHEISKATLCFCIKVSIVVFSIEKFQLTRIQMCYKKEIIRYYKFYHVYYKTLSC